MSLPIYLSVTKSSTFVNAESERIRQTAEDEWQYLQTVFVLLRPFLAVWFLLLHTSRWIYLASCYLMLFFAWVVRVIGYAVVVIVLLFALAWMLGEPIFDRSYYVSPTKIPSDSSSESEALSYFRSLPDSPSYTQSNQTYDYDTPSTSSASSSSGYQPRVSQTEVEQVMQGVYNFKSQQQLVDVSGYTRGDTYVQSYQRQPPGGINNFEAGMWALGVGAVIYGVDYTHQKYGNWSAQREAKARQQAQLEADEKARKEQQEFLAKWEAEERAREKEKKKSWWKKQEEPQQEKSWFDW